MSVSAWMVCGPSMTNAYWNRYEAENADPPQDYSGPMDDESYRLLSTMGDITNTQPQYNTKTVNGNNPFTLYGMNFPDEFTAVEALDYLEATWPGNQVEVQGAWSRETGLQLGVEPGPTDPDTGEPIGPPTGEPLYPIPANAYELMPPIPIFDEDGNQTGEIPPTSNDDLRDINLIYGQSSRQFEEPVTSRVVVIDPVGEQGDPAVIKFLGKWTPDASIQFSATLSNDDTSSVSFKPVGPLTPQQIANIVAALLDARPELIAQNANDTVRVRPTDSALTLTVTAYVGFP